MVEKGEVIKLSDGQKATVIVDPKNYKNIYIVRLKNHDIRVVGKDDFALLKSYDHSIY